MSTESAEHEGAAGRRKSGPRALPPSSRNCAVYERVRIEGENGESVAADYALSRQRIAEIVAAVETWIARHPEHPLAQRMRLRCGKRWDALWARSIESFDRSREDREVKKERVARRAVAGGNESPTATVTERTVRQQNGDPRFLTIAARIAEREDRLWIERADDAPEDRLPRPSGGTNNRSKPGIGPPFSLYGTPRRAFPTEKHSTFCQMLITTDTAICLPAGHPFAYIDVWAEVSNFGPRLRLPGVVSGSLASTARPGSRLRTTARGFRMPGFSYVFGSSGRQSGGAVTLNSGPRRPVGILRPEPRTLNPLCWAIPALLLFANVATADDAKVSFFKQIRPIFQEHCQGCHQPAKKSGGFVMMTVADMQKGGDSGEPALMPGNADKSLLIAQIVPDGNEPPAMPKGQDPLKPEEVELIRKWVMEGAADDTPSMPETIVDMEHPPVYSLPPVLTSLEFSPDGSLLAVSGYHEVLLHKADGGELAGRLVGISERIESARFSPDGKRLAVTGGSPGRFGEVEIWDVEKRALLVSTPVTYDTVYGASWSSDGAKVAFGCGDNTVRAIDAATGKQVLYQGAHSDWVLDTCFSTDNSHVVSVSRDGSMKLTDVATQRFEDNITSITPGALKGGLIVVRRNAKADELLIGGSDGVPKIYKMYRTQARQIGDDFNRITRFNAEPVSGRIFAAEYSPDMTKVAIGSSSDGRGEVRLLNEADGKTIRKFADQFGAVYSLAWRPDGKLLAVGGFDGKVRLFDPETGTMAKEFVPVPLTPATVAAK